MSETKTQPDVGIIFYEGLFSDEEIESVKTKFDSVNLSFGAAKKKPATMACLDFFVPLVTILLSQAFLQQLANGVITNAAYDMVKNCCLNVWHIIISKKPKKITGDKITEYKNCIQLSGNGFNAVFPQTTDETIILHYIEKSFEYLSHNSTKQREFLVLDQRGDFRRLTEHEVIKMAMQEQRQEKSVLMRVYNYIKNNPNCDIHSIAENTGINEKLCLSATLELQARGTIRLTPYSLSENNNTCFYSAGALPFCDDSEYCSCKKSYPITSDTNTSNYGYWDTCSICGKHIEDGFHYYHHFDGEDHDEIDM